MQFLESRFLLLALLLVILVPLGFYRLMRTRRQRAQLASAAPLRRLSSPSWLSAQTTAYVLTLLALAMAIAALAQPQWVRRLVQPEFKKMDIVFLIDASPSMRAEDVRPSRLERALDVIARFCEQKPSQDRVGLVAFSSGSLILSYLTEDVANIRYYLEYLRHDRTPRVGTNIGRALNSGLKVYSKEREVNQAAAEHKRVFILISDGEDHGAELEGAVRNVQRQGIKVHTIAIGSNQGAPIPIAWEDGTTHYLLDKKGNRVISHLDERTLRWIAQETGGGLYRALTGAELPRTFASIVEHEREIEGFTQIVQHRDMHEAFLFAAFGLLLTATLIKGARV